VVQYFKQSFYHDKICIHFGNVVVNIFNNRTFSAMMLINGGAKKVPLLVVRPLGGDVKAGSLRKKNLSSKTKKKSSDDH